ncbi:GNAT family N-acetyltransferase [Streptomyces omiyaensis]|uniref:GNAT family N-acetyltransferase n=1 Tax=Streptomyces omiyaensis TaxID=68247 RepID=UPI0036F542B1
MSDNGSDNGIGTGDGDGAGFSLRKATGGDAEFLVDMLMEATNWDPGREAVTRARVLAERRTAHYVEGWPRAGDLGLVAVAPDGRPIGAVWLRLFPHDDPGYGFVAPDVPELTLGVAAAWRRRGVGRALLAEAARRAAEHGHTRLSLSVERANHAHRLYADEGFETVESGVNSDTMVKPLPA